MAGNIDKKLSMYSPLGPNIQNLKSKHYHFIYGQRPLAE